MRVFIVAAGLAVGFTISGLVAVAFAWTGPTGSAPSNNVSAPLNVGSASQVKSGTIGVNGLAVFGNTLLGGSAGSNAYLNFGGTSGSSGYGIWDDNGTLNFKNSGGSWSSLQSIIYSYTQGSSQWTTNGSSIYYSSGNVGIGTASPSHALDVNGWIGSLGSDGWTSDTYGGSIWMQDSTWVRVNPYEYVYNGYDSGGPSAAGCGGALGGGYEFRVCGTADVTSSLTAAQLCLNGSCISSWPSQTSLPYPVTSSQKWNWSGQSGQPSWVWGSNDGNNFYVWNPSNFDVAYASSAGNANTVDGYGLNQDVTSGASPTFGAMYTSGGAQYQSNGDIYMPWKGEWLSTVLSSLMTQNTWINGVYYATNGDMYIPYLGSWLSQNLNQNVTTGGTPTFNNVYISSSGVWLSNAAVSNGAQFYVYGDGNYLSGTVLCPSGSVMVGIPDLMAEIEFDVEDYVNSAVQGTYTYWPVDNDWVLCQWIN